MSDFYRIACNIQKLIDEELNRGYGRKAIEHWHNPKNWGIMNKADGYAKITGPCGDTMEISILVEDNRIIKCTFDTDGCGATVACGSIVTELATGKSIFAARQIDQQKVLDYCGGFPDENTHCALLAANTLQRAIDKYLQDSNLPWKKFYRK